MIHSHFKKLALPLALCLCVFSPAAHAEDSDIFDADAMRAEFGDALTQDNVLGNDNNVLELMGVMGEQESTPATAAEIMKKNAPSVSTQIGPGFSMNNPEGSNLYKTYMDSATTPKQSRKHTPPQSENDIGSNTPVWTKEQVGYASPNTTPAQRTVPQNLLSKSHLNVHLVRPQNNSPNEFTLRFSQPVSASGCINVAMPDPQIVQRGKILWIIVGSPVIGLNSAARYANHDCQQNSNGVRSDVILNRKSLLEENIEKIYLQNDFGADVYKLEFTENSLTLRPKTQNLFMPNNRLSYKDPMQFWFYPKNTLILHVPGGKDNEQTYEQINKLASSKGLINLESVVKGFDRKSTGQNNYYFIDPAGITFKTLQNDKGVLFGKIKGTETFYGPQGPYEEKRSLTVFAKLPSELE